MSITEQQIAFPVPRYCTILDTSWALTDTNGINDLPMDRSLLGVVA